MSDPKKMQTSVYKRSCCVPFCSSQPNDKRSYHYFPKHKKFRDQWISACKLDKTVKTQIFVCSNHFIRTDFLTGPECKRQILKSTAVPSLNLPDESYVPPKVLEKVTADEKQAVTSDVEENMTIIYLPSSCSKVIGKTGNLMTNSILQKSDSTFDEKDETSEILTFEPHDEDLTVISEKKRKIDEKESDLNILNNSNPQNQENKSNLKHFNPVGNKQKNLHNKLANKATTDKYENPNINIHTKQNNKKVSNKQDVFVVTLCAGCSEYCKIDDEDLLDINKKNMETLAAETLLELQELYPSNEDERILLTKKGIEICDKVLQGQAIDLMKILTNDNELVAFTGINFPILDKLANLITLFEGSSIQKYSAPVRNRIVLCLCKLRTNVSFRSLAMLFGLSQQICTTYFFAMIRTLSLLMEKTIYWPKTEELLKSLPKCFQSFKQTRVILSCNETQIEKQRCLKCQVRLASTMKNSESIKLILGVAPSGLIIFKSNVFESQATNNSIFSHTNILEQLDPAREAIMADKSLNIESECAERNITLIKLPKLDKDKYFSKNDVELIKNISAARIHVDRTLQRFKMFKIMQAKISWRILPFIDDVCTIIAGIVNMKNPIPPDESRLQLSKLI